MVGAVGRDLHHKPVTAELAHQRGIFPHRVQYDNAVIGGEEHVHKLPFPGEALPGARHAQVQSIRVFFSFFRSAMMTLWERAFRP